MKNLICGRKPEFGDNEQINKIKENERFYRLSQYKITFSNKVKVTIMTRTKKQASLEARGKISKDLSLKPKIISIEKLLKLKS